MINIYNNVIYCTVTFQECLECLYWIKFQSKIESSGLNSELIQQCFEFKHEKFCVRPDEYFNSELNFLVKSGPQNSIVTHQSHVSFHERFNI